MLIDLHVKSDHTPGVKTNIKDALQRAKKAQLDGVLFADKLASSHCKDVLEAAEEVGIKAFIGVEIPTDKGHFIGVLPEVGRFYEEEEWKHLTSYTTPAAEDVLELFAKHNGAVIAVRPYDREIPYKMGDFLFVLNGIHAIEVMNPCTKPIENDFALEASRFLGLQTAGGSDAPNGKPRVGSVATFFTEDITTQSELVQALRESEFWAIQLDDPNKPSKSNKNDNRRNNHNQSRDNNRKSDSKNNDNRRRSRSNRRGSNNRNRKSN